MKLNNERLGMNEENPLLSDFLEELKTFKEGAFLDKTVSIFYNDWLLNPDYEDDYSERVTLIDAKTNQVIIPLTKECEDIVNKIRLGIILKSDIRKLSKYTVSLYDKDFNEYKSKGLLNEIAENIFVLSDMNQYNEYSGLSTNPTFEDAIYLW